jgi:hypothetical protein
VIQPRELPEQIADVGPDAEIVQFAGVEADAHGLIILRWAGQAGGAGGQKGQEGREGQDG